MRPRIDEQLTGAARLLRLAEQDPDTPRSVAELVHNARRLVDRVGTSWTFALPFLTDDSARTAELLGLSEPPAERDLITASARNEELRAALSTRLRELPAGPERAAIGAHLRARVAADPT